jgi:hypothetical protein
MAMAIKKFTDYFEERSKGLGTLNGAATGKPPRSGKFYDLQPDPERDPLPYSNPADDFGLVIADVDGKTPLGDLSSPKMDKGVKKVARPKVHKTSSKELKEYLDETAGMSAPEVVNYFLERKEITPISMVHDLHGHEFTPSPHEAVNYVCSLMDNPKIINRIIREMRKNGHLSSFVTELLEYPEFFEEVVSMMGDKGGGKIAGNFAMSMRKNHDDFMGGFDSFDESYYGNGRLLSEKVVPGLDDELDPEQAGMPGMQKRRPSFNGGSPMTNPGTNQQPGMQSSLPGMDTQQDAEGMQYGQDMNAQEPGMGDMSQGGQGMQGMQPTDPSLDSAQDASGEEGDYDDEMPEDDEEEDRPRHHRRRRGHKGNRGTGSAKRIIKAIKREFPEIFDDLCDEDDEDEE